MPVPSLPRHARVPRASTAGLVLLLLFAASTAEALDRLAHRPIFGVRRGQEAFAYDSRRHRIVVFGGVTETGQPTNEADVLDLAGQGAWQRLLTTGTPPPSTGFETAAYDSIGDRLLVFARADPGVWSLDLAGTPTWQALQPTGTRPTSKQPAVVYDPARDRVVGFGGYAVDGSTTSDTWVLTLGTQPAWAPLVPGGGAPPDRAGGGHGFDPVGDRMLVFGGESVVGSARTLRNDTWQLTFAGGIPTWSAIPATGALPPARTGCALVVQPDLRRLVLFGGRISQTLADTWILPIDDPSPAWVALATGPKPEPRFGAAAAFDPIGGCMVVAGGSFANAPGTANGDLWQLPLGPIPGSWSELPVRGQGTYQFTVVGYDASTHRSLAFSTRFDNTRQPWFASVTDSTWIPVIPAYRPAAFSFYSSASFWDPTRDRAYTFSRDSLYTVTLGASPAWTAAAIAGTRPTTVVGNSTAWFDVAGKRLLAFGGIQTSHLGPDPSTPQFWILGLNGSPAWTKVADTTPLGVRETPAIHDTRRNRLLFVGGYSPNGNLNDVWALDLATFGWTQLRPAGVPLPSRSAFSAAYDSLRDRAIVYGGYSLAPTSAVVYLEFGPSDAQGKWLYHDPVGATITGPPARGVAWDPGLDALVVGPLVGGTNFHLLTWGPHPRGVTPECPAPAPWSAGGVVSVPFGITQDQNSAHAYAWRLDADRAWPGFPLFGQVSFPASGTMPVPIGVPVPDTASAGSVGLRFSVQDLADPTDRDSCLSTLAAPAAIPPGPLAFVGGNAIVLRGGLTVNVAVPGPGAVVLEAVDARGRRVAVAGIDPGSAGQYAITLDAARPLRSGLYFLRLVQGAERVTGRAVLLTGD